ncbi:uncharacterized protein [Typha angustifolia]|uniref:uncharacterized protein n=1 Tax=Typha angustifolia TaxID=59011 RepID=UPI003C302683
MASRSSGRNGHHPALLIPSHLLEITIISAQDLKKWSQSVNAYAAAWVHPGEKLYTQVDRVGRTDPTWNDKFVFRIDNAFLRSDTSAVTVTIYATRSCLNPRKDPILGVARILLSASLGPSPANAGSRRVVALQVRQPRSLRPQGILNVAVALLDSYSHSNGKKLTSKNL